MKITKSQLKQIIKEEMEAVQETDWARVTGLGNKPHEPGASVEDKREYAYVNECFRSEEVNSIDFIGNEEAWQAAFNKCMNDKIRQLKIKQDPKTWLGEADNTPELKDA
tara:strand:+ start:232 stop:558 length:327 start_codon:yes stop_codon:yes gene_type:complete